MLYAPRDSEWPTCGRDAECDRIVRGLENHIMQLSIAEPFLVPVDLGRYPVYAMVIEYPIDLTTIKSRLENRLVGPRLCRFSETRSLSDTIISPRIAESSRIIRIARKLLVN